MIGLAALLAAAPLLAPSPAAAQGDPEAKAAAEVLFREGLSAFNAGDYATACPRLQTAVTLTAGEALGGALLLAKCLEKQGKTASAWTAYNEVAGKARAASQAARAAEAEGAAAALFPRLHYVTLAVPPEITALPGAQILRQGKPLRRELWSIRIPIDPGPLAFEVTAPGKRPSARSVQIPDAPGDTTVTFDPLADEPAPPAPTAAPSTAPASTAGPSASPAAPSPSVSASPTATPPPDAGLPAMTGPRVAGVILAVAGLAGVGAGIGVGAAAKADYDAAVKDPSNDCRPGGSGVLECNDASKPAAARSLGDAGTAVFFAGAGVAAAGALLFLLAPGPSRAPAGARAADCRGSRSPGCRAVRASTLLPAVALGPGGAAFTWTGAF